MILISTIPAGHGDDLVKFSFGNMPFITDYTFPQVSTVGGYDFVGWSTLHSLSFPNLTDIDLLNEQSGGLYVNNTGAVSVSAPVLSHIGGNLLIANNSFLTSLLIEDLIDTGGVTIGGTAISFAVAGNSALTTIDFPALTSCDGQVDLSQCAVGSTLNFPALTTINGNLIASSANFTTLSLPSVVTINGNVIGSFNSHLTTVSMPNWVPQPGKQIVFSSCPALTAASVNHILSRCVANTAFTGSASQVLLSGAAPTGTGITDKATLIARGCTVVTN